MGDDLVVVSYPGAIYWIDIFHIYYFVKIVLFVWKRPKINEKEAGVGPFKKTLLSIVHLTREEFTSESFIIKTMDKLSHNKLLYLLSIPHNDELGQKPLYTRAGLQFLIPPFLNICQPQNNFLDHENDSTLTFIDLKPFSHQ